MTEDEAIEIGWQANIDRVQAAKARIASAVQNAARVETAVARACARQRFPTLEELARIDAARAVVAAAHVEHEAAKLNFKAGVTPEQIAEIMG